MGSVRGWIRQPGQCPGILDSEIHKDTVIDVRETGKEAGAEFRKHQFHQGSKGERDRSEREIFGTRSQVPEPIPGLGPLPSRKDPPFLTRLVLSFIVPGLLSAPSLATAGMSEQIAGGCCRSLLPAPPLVP